MITVVIENLFDTGKQTLNLIKEISFFSGIRTQTIVLDKKIIYKNNKKVPVKSYLEELKEEDNCDLLIIGLTDEGIKKQLYEHLNVHIAVLFHKDINKRSKQHKLSHMSNHMLEKMASHYYILPHEYKFNKDNTITYGWSEDAHLSASSAKVGVDGEMELQCCVGKQISTFVGTRVGNKEFSISSTYQNTEAILAATATMVLCGIDMEFYEKNAILV